MLNAAISLIHPDPPESMAVEYRIEGSLAVRAVLRDLMLRETPVALYPEGRCDAPLVARITHVDQSGLEFDVSGPPDCVFALVQARGAIGVALPDHVKTQFVLSEVVLLDDAQEPVRATPTGLADAAPATLHASFPVEIHRVQRRDAFRVRPPLEDDACCVQRVAIGEERRYRLLDLSAGGLSIRVPSSQAAPAPGSIWRHSRIETAGSLVIPCELVVRGVYEDPQSEGARRVAFAFHAMDSEVLRRVQVYVIDIEKRLRRLG